MFEDDWDFPIVDGKNVGCRPDLQGPREVFGL